jgi:hypothetical protein
MKSVFLVFNKQKLRSFPPTGLNTHNLQRE